MGYLAPSEDMLRTCRRRVGRVPGRIGRVPARVPRRAWSGICLRRRTSPRCGTSSTTTARSAEVRRGPPRSEMDRPTDGARLREAGTIAESLNPQTHFLLGVLARGRRFLTSVHQRLAPNRYSLPPTPNPTPSPDPRPGSPPPPSTSATTSTRASPLSRRGCRSSTASPRRSSASPSAGGSGLRSGSASSARCGAGRRRRRSEPSRRFRGRAPGLARASGASSRAVADSLGATPAGQLNTDRPGSVLASGRG